MRRANGQEAVPASTAPATPPGSRLPSARARRRQPLTVAPKCPPVCDPGPEGCRTPMLQFGKPFVRLVAIGVLAWVAGSAVQVHGRGRSRLTTRSFGPWLTRLAARRPDADPYRAPRRHAMGFAELSMGVRQPSGPGSQTGGHFGATVRGCRRRARALGRRAPRRRGGRRAGRDRLLSVGPAHGLGQPFQGARGSAPA